jgi:hypothetical protein
MPDDDLDSQHQLFVQRVRSGDETFKTARAVLKVYEARLDLLEKLQRTPGLESNSEIKEAVEEQVREIRELDQLLAELSLPETEE